MLQQRQIYKEMQSLECFSFLVVNKCLYQQSLLNLIALSIKAQELEIHEMRHTLDKAGPWLSVMSCWTRHAMIQVF